VNVTLVGNIVFVSARTNSTVGLAFTVDGANYDIAIPEGLRPPSTFVGFASLDENGVKMAHVTITDFGQISISKFDYSSFILGESVAIHPWCISYHL
jgi:hypothetical protein